MIRRMSDSPDSKRFSGRLANLALALGSLALCLLVLELVCRLLPADRGEVQLNDPYRYVKTIGRPKRFEPLHSYRERIPLEYDHQGYYAPSKGLVHFHANQLGARWLEAAEQPLAGRTILVLGDSFTYGHGLRYEDCYVHLLERQLAGAGSPATLLNFSQRGTNAKRNLANYREVRERAAHSEVLYGLNVNDLAWFPASHFATNPLALPRLTEHWKGYAFLAGRVHRWLIRRQRIADLVSPAVFESEAFAANLGALETLHREAAARGTPLTVALLPIMVDLEEGTFHPLYDGIRQRIEARGIRVVDLSRCVDGLVDRDLWILPFDQHPNAEANQVFAGELLPHLLGEKGPGR
jgi:lysophospholipase L1-like esterase